MLYNKRATLTTTTATSEKRAIRERRTHIYFLSPPDSYKID